MKTLAVDFAAMADKVDREKAEASVRCVKDPIAPNPQFEDPPPLLSSEGFWGDVVEVRCKPAHTVES